MTTTNFLSVCFILLVTFSSYAQDIIPPYLKSCQNIEDPSDRNNCSQNKFIELLRNELLASEDFKESVEDFQISFTLKVSSRGIIRFESANYSESDKGIIQEAISNIGYKVVMVPALQNEETIDYKLEMNLKIPRLIVSEAHKGQNFVEVKESNAPPPENIEIFKVVEVMPKFPGCEDSNDQSKEKCSNQLFLEYLYSNLRPTKNGYDSDVEGMYVVKFVVREDGSIWDIKFDRKPADCSRCEEDIVRVLNGMPKWNPGMQRSRKVNVLYTLPIKYRKEKSSKTRWRK